MEGTPSYAPRTLRGQRCGRLRVGLPGVPGRRRSGDHRRGAAEEEVGHQGCGYLDLGPRAILQHAGDLRRVVGVVVRLQLLWGAETAGAQSAAQQAHVDGVWGAGLRKGQGLQHVLCMAANSKGCGRRCPGRPWASGRRLRCGRPCGPCEHARPQGVHCSSRRPAASAAKGWPGRSPKAASPPPSSRAWESTPGLAGGPF